MLCHVRLPILTAVFYVHFREEHLEKKIETMVKEAKAKMGKGDKKGTVVILIRTVDGSVMFKNRKRRQN